MNTNMHLNPDGMAGKLKMSAMKDRFTGKAAAVLGGGPSLPADMGRLPASDDGSWPIRIAVNYHAFHLCRPDFIVYNDHPGSDPLLEEAIRDSEASPGFGPGIIRVSPEPTSDIIFDVPVWTGFYSSNTAAWLGLWMGCDPVILCGCDLYQGERKYFHPYQNDAPCFHYPLEDHIRPWVEEGRHMLPHVERLKAMSGPLGRIFGFYELNPLITQITQRGND